MSRIRIFLYTALVTTIAAGCSHDTARPSREQKLEVKAAEPTPNTKSN